MTGSHKMGTEGNKILACCIPIQVSSVLKQEMSDAYSVGDYSHGHNRRKL